LIISLRKVIGLLDPLLYTLDASTDEISGICLDSRKVKPGDLFVAINTGINFIPQALENGAACAITEQKILGIENIIIVENMIEALGRLAKLWLSEFDCQVIAVTGSCGKTTTTQMIAHVLSAKHKVCSTYKNHNNKIGVPETIFGINEETEFLVLELGTSEKGEMRYLATMVTPDVGVITNIGHAHLEAFETLDGVRREKSALLKQVKPDGLFVINGDNEQCEKIIADCDYSRQVITFGIAASCRMRADNLTVIDEWTSFEAVHKKGNAVLQFDLAIADHNIMNMLAAIAVARHFNIDWLDIQEGFEKFEYPKMRFETQIVNGVTIINDAYNANPDSAMAAILSAKSLYQGRFYFIFGDMLELGEQTEELHIKILEFAKMLGVDVVYGFGQYAGAATALMDDTESEFIKVEDRELIVSRLIEKVNPGDVVLFKASRAMQFDELHDKLCERLSQLDR